MTTKDLDAIMDRLTSIREHKKQIALKSTGRNPNHSEGNRSLLGWYVGFLQGSKRTAAERRMTYEKDSHIIQKRVCEPPGS